MTDEGTQHDTFVGLLAANTKRLYAFIRTLVFNDENDAEEIFQSACMALWKKFDEYDPAGDFGAWACRMAYFEVLRQRSARKRIHLMSEQALDALAEAAQPVARQIDERREALAECIDKPSDKESTMIRTRYFDGIRPKQIAERGNQSVYSVYRELNRIHALLLRCVERQMAAEVVE